MPPIIILGMHRSGTSLICRMLEDLGLYAGWEKDDNNEAKLFLGLNKWLLHQGSASWDNPTAFHFFLEHAAARQCARETVHTLLASSFILPYLGRAHYQKHKSLFTLDFPWAWKDPRNTFTLPFWLDLFPEARIIHVTRNGIDVARSLQVRQVQLEEKRMRDPKRGWFQPRRSFGKFSLDWTRVKPQRSSFRCASLEGGFSLWEEYVSQASRHVVNLGERAMEIRYEDVLQNPADSLWALSQFCRLDCGRSQVETVTQQIKPSRRNAYLEDATLTAFQQKVQKRLAQFGY